MTSTYQKTTFHRHGREQKRDSCQSYRKKRKQPAGSNTRQLLRWDRCHRRRITQQPAEDPGHVSRPEHTSYGIATPGPHRIYRSDTAAPVLIDGRAGARRRPRPCSTAAAPVLVDGRGNYKGTRQKTAPPKRDRNETETRPAGTARGRDDMPHTSPNADTAGPRNARGRDDMPHRNTPISPQYARGRDNMPHRSQPRSPHCRTQEDATICRSAPTPAKP